MPALDVLKRGGAVMAFVSLNSELDNIVSGIDDEVDEVLREETEKMADDARSRINNVSGDLEASVEVVEDDRPGYSGYRVVADVRSPQGVPYAHMVEYGHKARDGSDVAPRPFLTPALEEHRQETLDAVNEKLKELADQ